MRIPLSFLIIILLFISNCNNESRHKQNAHPSTPAQVAQEWIEAFYSDNFEKAMALGTDITRMMIDSVKKEMQPNAPVIAFKISNMSCQVKEDSARCTYIYQEEADQFQEYIDLIKQDGRWFVNESWESATDAELEFDMIREELEKILEAEEQGN